MRRAVLIAVSLLAFGCAPPPAPPSLPSVEKSAFLPAVRERLERAEKAARENPRDAGAAGELAMILHAHQLYSPAEACYRRARLLAPDEARWAYLLGAVQAAQGNKDAAASTLSEAVRLDPAYFPARLRLAEALWDSGKARQAGDAWREALRLDPNSAEASFGLGRAAAAGARWEDALEHFERAVSLFPRYSAAHHALAQAYSALGDSGRAERHRNLRAQFPESEPDVKDPWLAAVAERHAGAFDPVSRGVRLNAEGNFLEAIREFEAALKADPREVVAHQNLIVAYGALSRIHEAQSHYEQAVAINPQSAEAHFNWGVLMARTGRSGEAAEAFRKTVSAQPNHAAAHTNLGVLEEERGDQASARRHFTSAVESDPSDVVARFRLGRLLLAERRPGSAIVHLQAAARAPGPLESQALYGLAIAWKMIGNQPESLKAARQALAKAKASGQPALAKSILHDVPEAAEP